MARVVLGLALGILLVFPGVELLRFLAAQLLGAYDDMTLTEACLAMIIILQAIILLRGTNMGNPAASSGEPIILKPKRPRRRTTGQRRADAARYTSRRAKAGARTIRRSSRARKTEDPPQQRKRPRPR